MYPSESFHISSPPWPERLLKEIVSALSARGQYLPCDPPLVDAGATIGGTVAAGVSGPGRFRFGGIRDFILSVTFVDGWAQLLRMGGKVVKKCRRIRFCQNFFIGSLGRFGRLLLENNVHRYSPRPVNR